MKKKMDNKGFSLVELIIVIAIMVILVAVLAPQYLRYVERSRVATDTQTIVEFINAMQVAAADEDAALTNGETYTITSAGDSGSGGTAAITVSDDLKEVLNDRLGLMDDNTLDNTEFQSAAYIDAPCLITLSYNSTRLVWEVTASTTTGEVGISGKINE